MAAGLVDERVEQAKAVAPAGSRLLAENDEGPEPLSKMEAWVGIEPAYADLQSAA